MPGRGEDLRGQPGRSRRPARACSIAVSAWPWKPRYEYAMARSCQPQAVSESPSGTAASARDACTRWVTPRSRLRCRWAPSAAKRVHLAAQVGVGDLADRVGGGRHRGGQLGHPAQVDQRAEALHQRVRPGGAGRWRRASTASRIGSASRGAAVLLQLPGPAQLLDVLRELVQPTHQAPPTAVGARRCATRPAGAARDVSMIMPWTPRRRTPLASHGSDPAGAGAGRRHRRTRRGRAWNRRGSTPNCSPRTCWACPAAGCC